MSIIIIAEAGVNHNGNLNMAKKLIEEAKNAGADYVKFQTFVPEREVSRYAPKAEYQILHTSGAESQLEMIRRLKLEESEFWELKRYCDTIGIQFLSTPSDIESIHFLKQMNLPVWKIPSNEITDLPYLIEIAKMNQPVILSTGMSSLYEVREAVDILTKYGSGKITLLHCTTEYPTPYDAVNLKAMLQLREEFQLNYGYSDHTTGIEVPIAAAALGASIIEKHFTLDRSLDGPDHAASLEPDMLKQMITCIRNTELALGDGQKKVMECERKNIAIARKSIVADKKIKKGEQFSEANLSAKRPGGGISPMKWFEILGRKACRDYEEDEMIKDE